VVLAFELASAAAAAFAMAMAFCLLLCIRIVNLCGGYVNRCISQQ
jgi:hypothetical protein